MQNIAVIPVEARVREIHTEKLTSPFSISKNVSETCMLRQENLVQQMLYFRLCYICYNKCYVSD